MPESKKASSPTPPVKRACDCCHKRKVKCIGDGQGPCRNCVSAGLACTYNAIPLKKGPKGSRAKVISEIRETQQKHTASLSTTPTTEHGSERAGSASTPLAAPGLLPQELVRICCDFFLGHIYPTQPILTRLELDHVAMYMDSNVEAYCLMASLCAYMMIQPNMTPFSPLGDRNDPMLILPTNHQLLQEVTRLRRGPEHRQEPTIYAIMTSFFLFGCYFCLDRDGSAWFYLREATTLAYSLRMHDEDSYARLDALEASSRRRLYWLIFVTERAYALQRHLPLSLSASINLPVMDEMGHDSQLLLGFLRLIELFKPFDEIFVGVWNKHRRASSRQWLLELQEQLSRALPTTTSLPEIQAVDLCVTQQWLRTIIWQMSINHGYLSSHATEPCMTFNFPVEVARDLLSVTSGAPRAAMEVHGIGLVEKLFDIACTLIDVIAIVPIQQPLTLDHDPRSHLQHYLALISSLRGGQQRFIPLLLSKINDCLPNSTEYMPAAQPPRPPAATTKPHGFHFRRDEPHDTTEATDHSQTGGSAIGSAAHSPFVSPLMHRADPRSPYGPPLEQQRSPGAAPAGLVRHQQQVRGGAEAGALDPWAGLEGRRALRTQGGYEAGLGRGYAFPEGMDGGR